MKGKHLFTGFFLLICFVPLVALDLNEDVEILNQNPVELDISIGVDFNMGMVPGTLASLYVSGDWEATDSINLTFSSRLMNLGGLLLQIEKESPVGNDYSYIPDYGFNSTLKAGLEFPLASWIKNKNQRSYLTTGESYLTRRKFTLTGSVPYEKAFAIRGGYVHTIGGPDFLTHVQFEESGYSYQVFFQKNWHGAYLGISYYSKGAQLVRWKNGESRKEERQGQAIRHSLDVHYYFIHDMQVQDSPYKSSSTPDPGYTGPFTEMQLPLAIEYTFSFRTYGQKIWSIPGLGEGSGQIFMDTTIGYGPFFKAPSGIEYKDENSVFPFYLTFAVGWPIGR